MSRVRSKETSLEIKFRKELWHNKIYYRKNVRKYFGCPDVLIKGKKTVIFIDSCFWHGCKLHLRMPITNKNYWKEKIAKNISRDKQVSKHYKDNAWTVIRVWGHDLKNERKVSNILERIKNG